MQISPLSWSVHQLLADSTRVSPYTPERGETVVVYGAGSFARAVLSELAERNVGVRCLLDQRGQSLGSIDGVPVFVPGEEPIPLAERARVPVVVAVLNRDASIRSIVRLLHEEGYTRVVTAPELYDSLGDRLGSRFWLAPRALYEQHADRIDAAADLWADDQSRELYRSLLSLRLTWNPDAEPAPCADRQYFPADLPARTGPVAYVDCGAFTGDTIAAAVDEHLPLSEIFAFEPDLQNFSRLTKFVRALSAESGAKVSLWPCAVGADTHAEHFASGNGEGSCVAAAGDEVVPAVALDDVLFGAKVTDIKMDIEGAETDALHGAAEVIARNRPRLAICLYHRAADLWEIPLLVKAFDLSYDFYLRAHAHLGFELVMYGVPRPVERRHVLTISETHA